MELFTVLILILIILILMKLSTIEDMLKKVQKELERNAHTVVKPVNKVEEDSAYSLAVAKRNSEKLVLKKEIVQKETPQQEVLEKVKLTQRKRLDSQKVKELKPPTLTEQFEKHFPNVSLEELLFGNIILKIAIVAFILGIGLFLKYSIDKDWIPIWGRVLIGIVVGMAMLIAGIKMINNKHKLFSEGLFGGGIAVLYLSIFAAFALEGFMFISATYAYVSMIGITILAGVISVRFDAKSTAIFGLIGGFLTPFLLSTGSGNIVGLLTYMLVLNLGVLFVSIHKKWALLSWMAFGITGLTSLATVGRTIDDFVALCILYTLFFVIYSIVPFINQIRHNEQRLELSFVLLFWVNFIVAILSFLLLLTHYDVALIYHAVVTVALASYLLVYATVLTRKNVLMKNLFYIVLAQAIALLLLTPAFIFDGNSLTIVWAVESLMLLWIAGKSKEVTYALFALFGFFVTIVRYVVFDLVLQSEKLVFSHDHMHMLDYVKTLGITSFFVLGALFAGYKLLQKVEFDFKFMAHEKVRIGLFIGTFVITYLVTTYVALILNNYYFLDILSLVFMSIIALFSFLLYKSEYSKKLEFIFAVFIVLLGFSFISNLMNIHANNTLVSLLNFLLFMAVVGFIYNIAFKKSEITLSTHKLSDLMLGTGVGLLFLFLNVELYYVVELFSPQATKFAITLLWVLFGIVLFVFGVIKEQKTAKLVGTLLILLGILKAFFFDLANLDSIYRILLFIILGAILFALSYFYQNRQVQTKVGEEEL